MTDYRIIETFFRNTRPLIRAGETFATDEKCGTPPSARTIEQRLKCGVVVIDKPSGPSSHQVSAWVRDMLGLTKAGHAGTLDPNVTGVLAVTLSRATGMVNVLHYGTKEYVSIMRLHADVDEKTVARTLGSFQGLIYQIPPLKSAVKKRLRVRTVHTMKFIQKKEKMVLFRVSCDAGTYVRNICTDAGLAMGVNATMQELRRTRTGPFTEKDAVTLQDLKDAWVLWKAGDPSEMARMIRPPEDLLVELLPVLLRDSAVDSICHGAVLNCPGIVALHPEIKAGSLCALYTLKGEAVAVAEALMDADAISSAKKGPAFKTVRGIMETGIYPKGWKTGSSGVSKEQAVPGDAGGNEGDEDEDRAETTPADDEDAADGDGGEVEGDEEDGEFEDDPDGDDGDEEEGDEK